MSSDPNAPRRTRVLGVVRLSLARLWTQTTQTTSGRLVATVAAVSLTIGLLLTVTGVALALAGGGVVTEDDADVRVTPTEGTLLTSVNGVEGPRLGAANERAAEIRDRDGIAHASPVLIETTRLEPVDGGASELVVLVGVVPDDESRRIAGLPTDQLDPGDPHYDDGSYDGPRQDEIVLSRSGADRLGVGEDETLTTVSFRETGDVTTFTVAGIESDPEESTRSDAPVALVHASELQSLSGARTGSLADRVLIWGDPGAAEAAAVEAYPAEGVERNTPVDPSSLFDDGLAFVTSLLALVVGVVICAAFITTTMGMTVDEDRRAIAVLEAVGFPLHSRLTVVAVTTLATTLCGAVLGIGLGWIGVVTVNALAGATVAAAHPLFVPYALGVALVAGLLAIPYPLAMAARTTVLDEVAR